EDAHLTSFAFAPGTGGRTVYAAGVASCRAATCPPVLFRSTDGGASWSRILANGFDGTQLLVPPSPSDRRLFAMSRTGLQVSRNGGRSWQPALVFGESVAIGS